MMDVVNAGVITILEWGALALVFQRFGTIQGWTLAEVAFLYGLAELSYGLMDLVFDGFDPQRFGLYIRKGGLDQLLLRPVNIFIQVLGGGLAWRRGGKVIIGIGILAYSFQEASITWTVTKIIYLPFIIMGLILFFGGLYVIGATITFWTIESIEMVNVLTYGGVYTISHPMHIYPDWLRRFFTYILPAAFLNYYPALYYFGKPDPFNLPGFAAFLAPIAGIFVFISSLAIFHYGMLSGEM